MDVLEKTIINFYIDNGVVTDEDLLRSGVGDEMKSELLQRKFLKPYMMGYFVPSPVLIAEGSALLDCGNAKEAFRYFRKAYLIKTERKVCSMAMILECVYTGNFDNVEEYLEIIKTKSTDNSYYFILYLLSWSCDLPDNLVTIAKKITLDDILKQELDRKSQRAWNKVKMLAFSHDFGEAIMEYNKLPKKDYMLIHSTLISNLLERAYTQKRKTNRTIRECIKSHDYQKIVELGEKLEKRQNLSSFMKMAYVAASAIRHMQCTNSVRKVRSGDVNDICTSIEAGEFSRAIDIRKVYMKGRGYEYDPIVDMLEYALKMASFVEAGEKFDDNFEIGDNIGQLSDEELLNKILTFFSVVDYYAASPFANEFYRRYPNNKHTVYFAFVCSVMNDEYDRSIRLLDVIENVFSGDEKKAFSYYVYILSWLVELPINYKDMAFSYQPNDNSCNDFSHSIFKEIKEIAYPYTILQNMQDIICREIHKMVLNGIINKVKIRYKTIIDDVKNLYFDGDVVGSLAVLRKESEQHQLSADMEIYLQLLGYLNDYENGMLPSAHKSYESDEVLLSIKVCDFQKAYDLHCKNGGIQSDFTSYLLKEAINKKKAMDEVLECEKPKALGPKDVLTTCLVSLMNGNYREAEKLLFYYLKVHKLMDYDYLIENLVEIAILEGDTAFVRPMVTISALVRDEFVFDFKKYIAYYDWARQNGYLKIASIFFQTIVEGIKRGHVIVNKKEGFEWVRALEQNLSVDKDEKRFSLQKRSSN